MSRMVEIVFDPHIANALEATGAAVAILAIMKFIDYVRRKARER